MQHATWPRRRCPSTGESTTDEHDSCVNDTEAAQRGYAKDDALVRFVRSGQKELMRLVRKQKLIAAASSPGKRSLDSKSTEIASMRTPGLWWKLIQNISSRMMVVIAACQSFKCAMEPERACERFIPCQQLITQHYRLSRSVAVYVHAEHNVHQGARTNGTKAKFGSRSRVLTAVCNGCRGLRRTREPTRSRRTRDLHFTRLK